MKIALITRHAITNYGSLLQAFATQQVIEKLGHKCEIIDYIREDESYKQNEKTLLKNKPKWNNNPIKKLVYLALRQPESIIAGKLFEKERKVYLKLTKRYTSLKQLIDEKLVADIYMTGSDQVWGPIGDGSYDSVYCLSFLDDADKRIAYAASFGHTDMTDELENYFKYYLSSYYKIGVREESAIELLHKMDIEATQVIDPTLLLNYSFWKDYIQPIRDREYILVYQLHNDKRVGKYAYKVATEMGLPLIRVSASFHQIMREGKYVWCPNVGKFLAYIKNAKCIITDSFHGTAFAINFNVPFVEILPNNNTGTRNVSILKLLGLTDRILIDDDVSLAQKKIDFDSVNKVLEEKRQESLDILKQMIDI